VLFDAIEDAAFTSMNDIEGKGSLKSLFREADMIGQKLALKEKLNSFKVRIVLTAPSHPVLSSQCFRYHS
jgi:phosphoenolpyruvate carboxylase